jgi:hypothetical protein
MVLPPENMSAVRGRLHFILKRRMHDENAAFYSNCAGCGDLFRGERHSAAARN